MRILITNDDGINAPGLAAMEDIARDFAGHDAEIWVVAPAFEQSGVAHKISYTHPMMIAELGPRRVAAEGAPADCVIAALHEVMDAPPDLILSGVNRGNNSAENVLYSGTVGGAMEGALQGVLSIALSQYMGPETATLADPFEAARRFGPETIARILRNRPSGSSSYELFYNVNFPPVAAAHVKGITAAAQGKRIGTGFSSETHRSPAGRLFLWIKGGDQRAAASPGTDAACNLDGFVTVTPMRADLTAHDELDGLRAALAEPQHD